MSNRRASWDMVYPGHVPSRKLAIVCYSSFIIKSNQNKSNKCLHGFTCALSIYYTSKKSNMCNQQFLRLVAWGQIYRISLRIRYGLRCSHGFSYRWLSRSVLVGGFNPSEKYESRWEGFSHILWKIKNVPNHHSLHTVDGRNPAPPWMVETLVIMG